jgi:hypothetical protein
MSQRSRSAPHRRRGPSRRGGELPASRYAGKYQRLIGFGILAAAVLLIVIGAALD